jgi:hypothetical protein
VKLASPDIKTFFNHQNEDGFQMMCENISDSDARGNFSEAKAVAEILKENMHVIAYDGNNLSEISAIQFAFSRQDGTAMQRELGDQVQFPVGMYIVDWLSRSSSQDLVAFSHFYTSRRRERQRLLDRESPSIDGRVMEGVEFLSGADIFPEEAAGIFCSSMLKYGKYRALDSFESGSAGVRGYCTTDIAALANVYPQLDSSEQLSEYMLGVAFHERLHAAGWHGRGFLHGIATKRMMRLAEEAFVSLSTEAWRSPHSVFGTSMSMIIDPYREISPMQSYPLEGTLFAHELSSDESDRIGFDEAADVYFTQTESYSGHKKRMRLEHILGRPYHTPANYWAYNDIYESCTTKERREKFIRGVINRFVLPVEPITHIQSSEAVH